VTGASSAWRLAAAGLDVLVVERRPELGSLTTPKSFGSIRTQFGSPGLVDLATESLDFYRSAHEHFGPAADELDFCQPGYLYVTTRPDHRDRMLEALDLYASLGVRSELVEGAELRERFPFVGPDAAIGIFHADGGWIDPAAVTGCFADAAAELGAGFATGTEVHGIEVDDGAVVGVSTSRGRVATTTVVDCAGPFANTLLEPFGVRLPITTIARYRAFLPCNGSGIGGVADAPFTINIENGAYWRPVPGGVWLSHADADADPTGPLDEVEVPESFLAAAVARIAPISPFFRDLAAGLEGAPLDQVGGQPCYTPDDTPFIGPVGQVPGLFVNCGHWAGVMLAPAGSRLLADLVTGARADADNPCSLRRLDGDLVKVGTNKFGGWG